MLVALVSLLALLPQQPAPAPWTPPIVAASREAETQIQRFQPAPGLTVSLWAAEPMLANPVAFAFDREGRAFVAETWRIKHGVIDMRDYMKFLDEDIACRTVADRVALMARRFPDRKKVGTASEIVRLLVDGDHDGRADQSTVFADGFRAPEDGVAAGVLPTERGVLLTCIPKLWLLQPNRQRTVVHDGFGVHASLMGHDLHGLVVGPDRRIYFSIGDRGLHVVAGERTLAFPDEGAVLRMEPDGSGLEVYARGLRNPQELAFDRCGNLFTGDNNSDGGDRARFVQVLEGGDCGWRSGFQWLATRGPWNEEKLWWTPFPGQAPSINPPIAHVGNGPSGLCHDPGTGLPARYRDTFFLCDFGGAASPSGIWAIRLQPQGAAFEVQSLGKIVWRVLATDCGFGPDPGLYFSDWVHGWQGEGKGRIYRLFAPALDQDAVVAQTQGLLRRGVQDHDVPALLALLSHPDFRVRQDAQFALVDRGREAVAGLHETLRALDRRDARVHALWALSLLARQDVMTLKPVAELLDDADAEVRAQAAKVLGEHGRQDAARKLRQLLQRDPNARVRYFAAMALGRLGDPLATPALFECLRQNGDRDPVLRHGCVLGLAGVAAASGRFELLAAAGGAESVAVRIGALLALRRLGRPEVARFLADPDAGVVREAARAIHDEPIAAGQEALADLLQRPGCNDVPSLRRAVAAAHRLGDAPRAASLAAFAARAGVPETMRVEALKALLEWVPVRGVDRVLGSWRPFAADREPKLAAAALEPWLEGIVAAAPDAVREVAAECSGRYRLAAATKPLRALVTDRDRPGSLRRAALRALAQLDDVELQNLRRRVARDPDPALRGEAVRMLFAEDPRAALAVLDQVLQGGPVAEQQEALQTLRERKEPEADAVLARALDRLLAGLQVPEVALDLLEVAAARAAPAVQERLARHEAARQRDDPLAAFRECLVGGNKKRGNDLFWEDPVAACARCHPVFGSGGTGAGPDLGALALRMSREEMLESIVEPNRKIAPGYATLTVQLHGNDTKVGVVRAETKDTLELVEGDGNVLVLDKRQILSQGEAISAMPPVGLILSKLQIRDLVEYLASLDEKKNDDR